MSDKQSKDAIRTYLPASSTTDWRVTSVMGCERVQYARTYTDALARLDLKAEVVQHLRAVLEQKYQGQTHIATHFA